MHNNANDPNQPAYVNQSGYEKRDISLPTILTWVTFLFIFVIVSSVIAYGAYIFLSPKNLTDPAAISMNGVEPQEPPSPQLQAYPKTEMRDFRVLENKAVTSYGKYRGAEIRYRIPIDRAVELTAERGFPKTETMSKQAAAPKKEGENGRMGEGKTPPIQRNDSRNVDNQNAPIR